MAGPQYVYHMQGLSKTYPGGKKVFENIHLSFLPDAKIGVVGVNGADLRVTHVAHALLGATGPGVGSDLAISVTLLDEPIEMSAFALIVEGQWSRLVSLTCSAAPATSAAPTTAGNVFSYGGDATSIYDADGLAGFTADGQHVTAAVTVFYRLRRDEVRDLYLTLGNAWEGRLADVARQSLLETWSLFETDAFYTRRQAINAAMVSSVNASLHQFHAEATIVSMRQLKFAEQANTLRQHRLARRPVL